MIKAHIRALLGSSIALAVVVTWLTAAPALAADVVISGTVSSGGAATANAIVVARAIDGSAVTKTELTDGAGAYSLTVADSTNYTVTATAAGYQVASQNVSVGQADVIQDLSLTASNEDISSLPAYGLSVQNATLTSDPARPGVFYAGSAFSSQLYRTTNSGVRWLPVTSQAVSESGLPGLLPGNGLIPVATSGTAGEVAVATNTPNGPVVSVSKDFGTTWRQVGLPTGQVLADAGSVQLAWAHSSAGNQLFLQGIAANPDRIFVADPSDESPQFAMTPLAPLAAADNWDATVSNGEPTIAVARSQGTAVNFYSYSGGFDTPVASATGLTTMEDIESMDFGGQNGSSIAMSQYSFAPRAMGVSVLAADSTTLDWTAARTGYFNASPNENEMLFVPTRPVVTPDSDRNGMRVMSLSTMLVATGSGNDFDVATRLAGAGTYSGTTLVAFSGNWTSQGAGSAVAINAQAGGVARSTQNTDTGTPIFSDPGIIGLRDPLVRSTAFHPTDASKMVAAIDYTGGNQVVATADGGATFEPVVTAGGRGAAWWQGSSGTVLATGVQLSGNLINAVANWSPLSGSSAGGNVVGTSLTDLSAPGNASAEVRSLAGIPNTDSLFIGSWASANESADDTGQDRDRYAGTLFRGQLADLNSTPRLESKVQIKRANGSHIGTVNDLAYCPNTAESASTVRGALFAATGWLNWYPGQLLRVNDAATAPTPVATVLEDTGVDTVVDSVTVDCESGRVVWGTRGFDAALHVNVGGGTTDSEMTMPSGIDVTEVDSVDSSTNHQEVLVASVDDGSSGFGDGTLLTSQDAGQTWTEAYSALDEGTPLKVEELAVPPTETVEVSSMSGHGGRVSVRSETKRNALIGTQNGLVQGSVVPRAVVRPTPPVIRVPGAVRSLRVTNAKLTRTPNWAPPASNGGAPVTGYRYTLTTTYKVGKRTVKTTSTKLTSSRSVVIKFAKKRTYVFTVAARNSKGFGPPSSVTFRT